MAIPYKWTDALVERGWLRVLNRSEFVVLFALGKFVGKQSRATWVGTDTLVALTGYEPSTVYHALHGLRKHSLLDSSLEMRKSKVREREYAVEVHTLVEVEKIPIAHRSRVGSQIKEPSSTEPVSDSQRPSTVQESESIRKQRQ